MIIKNNKRCNIKINARNIEPCECCNNKGIKFYYENPTSYQYMFIEDNYLYAIDLERRSKERVEINYCPMCGRKLNE